MDNPPCDHQQPERHACREQPRRAPQPRVAQCNHTEGDTGGSGDPLSRLDADGAGKQRGDIGTGLGRPTEIRSRIVMRNSARMPRSMA